MKPITKMLPALALLAWLLAPAPALAQEGNSCRRAVVIYLDVSGSMYEQRFHSASPWKDGRQISLMEQAVWFLGGGLLSPQSRLARPEDKVILRGFYSKVAPLEPFIPGPLALGKDNPKQVADIAAKLRAGAKGFLAGGLTKTDFHEVVQDMTRYYRTLIGEQGDQGYDKLVFVILTDGGHDHQPSLGQFKKKIEEASAAMQAQIEKGRVQVHFFGVVADGRGEFRELAREHDVSPDFQRHLKARFNLLDLADLAQVNRRLAELAERIEIRTVQEVRYEQGSASGQGAPAGQIKATLTLENHSCQEMVLERAQCTIYLLKETAAGTPADQAGPQPVNTLKARLSQTMAGRGRHEVFAQVEVAFAQALAPGRYRLELSALSKGLGLGQGPPATVELEVKAPPPPPPKLEAEPVSETEDDGYENLVLAGVALVALACIVLYFARSKRRRVNPQP